MRSKSRALLMVFLLSIFGLLAQTVDFKISESGLIPGDTGKISATLHIPQDMKQSLDPADPIYFYLEAEHPDLIIGEGKLPPATKVVSDTEWEYYPKVTLSLPFTVKDGASFGRKNIKVTMSYNLCYDSGMCEPPDSKEAQLAFDILAPAKPAQETQGPISMAQVAPPKDDGAEPMSGGLQSEETTAEPGEEGVDESAEMGIDPAETASASDDEGGSPWHEVLKYLVFAFLGGLILNITPCVLPILPIRIMAIINQAQEDRSKVFRHVSVYTVGVLISFAILAAIFIGIQAAGQSAGWGTQNQNPYFGVGLMAIVFVFALSLLGVFEITVPGMNKAGQASSRGGYSGSFFGGIFAFLMAISCTGPFLGAALPFAMRLPSLLIMLFFLMIGLGFAFPFILIGIFPKALKIIPKPGNWMVIFKQLMGFVLLYLVYTMLRTTLALTSGLYLLNVIFFLLILGLAVWLYGRFVRFEYSRLTQWVFTILALILIVWGVFSYLPITDEHLAVAVAAPKGDEMVRDPHAPEGWYIFSPELHQKLISEGQPVFLDIGAEWCKNCKTNERTVLFTDEVMASFKGKDVALLRGDFTRKDPVLLKWIQDHGRMGVPFNALYIPGEEPMLFPELINKNTIREALAKVPHPGDRP